MHFASSLTGSVWNGVTIAVFMDCTPASNPTSICLVRRVTFLSSARRTADRTTARRGRLSALRETAQLVSADHPDHPRSERTDIADRALHPAPARSPPGGPRSRAGNLESVA